MRVISHPFRLDSTGNVVTVEQGSPRHAAEIAGAVVATEVGERGLAPFYGLRDPAGLPTLDDSFVSAAVDFLEPELVVRETAVTRTGDGRTNITVNVEWR